MLGFGFGFGESQREVRIGTQKTVGDLFRGKTNLISKPNKENVRELD